MLQFPCYLNLQHSSIVSTRPTLLVIGCVNTSYSMQARQQIIFNSCTPSGNNVANAHFNNRICNMLLCNSYAGPKFNEYMQSASANSRIRNATAQTVLVICCICCCEHCGWHNRNATFGRRQQRKRRDTTIVALRDSCTRHLFRRFPRPKFGTGIDGAAIVDSALFILGEGYQAKLNRIEW